MEKRYTLKCLCWFVEGEEGELVQPEGASVDYLEVWFVGQVVGEGTMYGTLLYLSYLWDLEDEEVWDTLNSSFKVAMKVTRARGAVFMGNGVLTMQCCCIKTLL